MMGLSAVNDFDVLITDPPSHAVEFLLTLFCSSVQLLDTVAWLFSRLRQRVALIDQSAGPCLNTGGSMAIRISRPVAKACSRAYAAVERPVKRGCNDIVDGLVRLRVMSRFSSKSGTEEGDDGVEDEDDEDDKGNASRKSRARAAKHSLCLVLRRRAARFLGRLLARMEAVTDSAWCKELRANFWAGFLEYGL
eukprot:3984169-Prymnesium_polylepis.2